MVLSDTNIAEEDALGYIALLRLDKYKCFAGTWCSHPLFSRRSRRNVPKSLHLLTIPQDVRTPTNLSL